MKNILQLTKFLFLVLGLGTFLPNCLNPFSTKEEKNKGGEALALLALQQSNTDFSPFVIDSVNCDDPAPPGNSQTGFNCTVKISGGRNASCSIAVSGSMGDCKVNVAIPTFTSCSNGDNTIPLRGTDCSNLTITLTFTVNSFGIETVKSSKQVQVNL